MHTSFDDPRRPAAELLAELRALGEHERIEAKKGLGKEALHTACAFANEPDLGGATCCSVSSPTTKVATAPSASPTPTS